MKGDLQNAKGRTVMDLERDPDIDQTQDLRLGQVHQVTTVHQLPAQVNIEVRNPNLESLVKSSRSCSHLIRDKQPSRVTKTQTGQLRNRLMHPAMSPALEL